MEENGMRCMGGKWNLNGDGTVTEQHWKKCHISATASGSYILYVGHTRAYIHTSTTSDMVQYFWVMCQGNRTKEKYCRSTLED